MRALCWSAADPVRNGNGERGRAEKANVSNRKNSASNLVSGRFERSVDCSASRNHMPDFDYLARAELFLGSDWATATSLGHRAFRRAAHALRFAFEGRDSGPLYLYELPDRY